MPKDKTQKEKPKKQPSPQDAEDQILAYLVQQNRPYSSTDVYNNLQQVISKPNCNKALASLAEASAIQAKTFGKQVIYCALQTQVVDSSSEVELDSTNDKQATEEELGQLQTELATLVEDNKRAAKEVAESEGVLTIAQLLQKQEELEEEESKLDDQIALLEANKPKKDAAPARTYTEAEQQQIDKTLRALLLRWKGARKQFEDIFKDFATALGKKKSDMAALREEMGVDEVDADMPLPSYI